MAADGGERQQSSIHKIQLNPDQEMESRESSFQNISIPFTPKFQENDEMVSPEPKDLYF